MFSFGNKKPAAAAVRSKQTKGPDVPGKSRNLGQFGLLDMGAGDDMGGNEDDYDLEAELAALTSGAAKRTKKAGPKLVSEQELAAMVSNSMADIPSDAELSDVDDADVEDELNELCGDSEEEEESLPQKPVLQPQQSMDLDEKLQQRLSMYEVAEKNAAASGDTVKARRFGRGVKTIRDLIKQSRTGKPVNVEDIPPLLAESARSPPKPSSAASHPGNVRASSPPEENFPQYGVQNTLIDLSSTQSVPATMSVLVPTRPVPSVPVASRPAPMVPVSVNPELIPVNMSQVPRVSIAPEPASTGSSDVDSAIARRQEFKTAALAAKRAGDQGAALQLVRLVKVCDQLINAAQQGEIVDWSLLPPPVNSSPLSAPDAPKPVPAEVQSQAPQSNKDIITAIEPSTLAVAPAEVPQPSSTLEALEQRLVKYQSSMAAAKEEGNSSKERRMGRIVKQYQDAIKRCKTGKPVPFDELPDPPGYPPIPGAPKKVEESDGQTPAVEAPSVPLVPSVASGSTPTTVGSTSGGPQPAIPPKILPKKTALATRQDKQLAALLERQTMFKQAALEAKKGGEIEQAKEYLRMAKGIDPLISANKCGVPVDMDTLPIPPQMKLRPMSEKGGSIKAKGDDGFVVLSSEEYALVPSLGHEASSLLTQLEADLVTQFKMCCDNRDHYKLMGDIANANRFDQLALHTRKDLDVVRSSAVRGDNVPRWKNEMKTFSIVKCCTDLKDDDMEITVLRGLSYNVPNHKTIDTYVRFEVPLPNSDNPTKDKTKIIYDTNSPEYNQSFHVNISRQSRTLLRIFKAKQIKFEVWAKGGFLRSDTLIGTATVKLADLINHCQIHEAADLMDGRKLVGGKLEVKIRLRDPIVGKEVEQVQEKWTVLIQ